jgi:hypothetical protein
MAGAPMQSAAPPGTFTTNPASIMVVQRRQVVGWLNPTRRAISDTVSCTPGRVLSKGLH